MARADHYGRHHWVRSVTGVMRPLLVPRFQFGATLETLKQPGGSGAEDETSDMSHIGDAACLDVCYGTDLTEELNQKPDAYQQRRRNDRDSGEYAKQKQRPYSITRISN